MLKVSISSLGTYESCPRKYKYEKIDKLPRKSFEHLDVGNYVHEVLEYFHKRLNEDATQHPETLLKSLAKEIWEKYKFKVSPEGLEKSKELLKAYLGHVGASAWPNVLATEDRFSLDLSEDVMIRGVIDRIDRLPDGSLQIVDYKTGKSKYLDKFQLQVYGLHLKTIDPDIKEYSGKYIVLPEGPKELSYTFTMADVEEAKQDVLKTAEHIATDKTWDPKPQFLCKFCDFSDVCPDSWEKRGSNNLVKIGRASMD